MTSPTEHPTGVDTERLRALCDAASPGPWGWRGQDDGLVELRGRSYLGPYDARIVSAMRSEPCLVALADESIALAYGACSACEESYEARDIAPSRRCEKDDNLGTVWLKGEHAVEPANTWAVREQPYRSDVARVDHPDAEFIAEARTALPALLAENEGLRAENERMAAAGCGALDAINALAPLVTSLWAELAPATRWADGYADSLSPDQAAALNASLGKGYGSRPGLAWGGGHPVADAIYAADPDTEGTPCRAAEDEGEGR